MIKGKKLIYGANDKAHSIECVYTQVNTESQKTEILLFPQLVKMER